MNLFSSLKVYYLHQMKSFSSLARLATLSPTWPQITLLIIIGIIVIYYPPALKFFNRLYQLAIKVPQITAIIVAVCLAIGIKISNPFEPPVNPHLQYVPDDRLDENPTQINKRNVNSKTKKLVASRQNWRCGICGRKLDETFEVDHVIPLYKGGSNGMENLVALDPICHRKKTRADRLGLKIAPVGKPDNSEKWGL
jgi:5-methylcytosine-specific restriction endonuclease McrA